MFFTPSTESLLSFILTMASRCSHLEVTNSNLLNVISVLNVCCLLCPLLSSSLIYLYKCQSISVNFFSHDFLSGNAHTNHLWRKSALEWTLCTEVWWGYQQRELSEVRKVSDCCAKGLYIDRWIILSLARWGWHVCVLQRRSIACI